MKLNYCKLLRCSVLIDGNAFAGAPHRLKTYSAAYQSEKCIVASFADIRTRMDLCAALPDKNIAGKHVLPVSPFRP